MFEDDCHSVNLKIGSGNCELLVNGTEGHTDAEWSFYTTGTDANKVGALCEKWSPCEHVCIDVCDANNHHTYVCLESFNVARQGEVTIPHTWGDNSFPAHLVIDGDHSTFTATGSGHGYTWVKIDLRYLFYVKSVRLYPRPGFISRSVNMVVQSSVDDTEYSDYGLTVATMPYSDYSINAQARFVKLERLNTAQSIFDGAEIEVYI